MIPPEVWVSADFSGLACTNQCGFSLWGGDSKHVVISSSFKCIYACTSYVDVFVYAVFWLENVILFCGTCGRATKLHPPPGLKAPRHHSLALLWASSRPPISNSRAQLKAPSACDEIKQTKRAEARGPGPRSGSVSVTAFGWEDVRARDDDGGGRRGGGAAVHADVDRGCGLLHHRGHLPRRRARPPSPRQGTFVVGGPRSSSLFNFQLTPMS